MLVREFESEVLHKEGRNGRWAAWEEEERTEGGTHRCLSPPRDAEDGRGLATLVLPRCVSQLSVERKQRREGFSPWLLGLLPLGRTSRLAASRGNSPKLGSNKREGGGASFKFMPPVT
jgi:hypothetical protein